MEEYEYWAPCPRGLEEVCAQELRDMKIKRVRPLKSGVAFFGPLEAGYRAALWSRTVSRILLVIGRVNAADADLLYEGIRRIDWSAHLKPDGTLCVDAGGVNDALRNTQFTAVRVKDAVCDRFRDETGVRPGVDTDDPDIRINVAVRGTKATIAIDLAGQSLHRRGYRKPGHQLAAPLKEALAAGILLLADWPAIAMRGGSFIDPLCGSGTLVIEAALIAGDVAPGILRTRWGFERWLGHDREIWEALLDEADERAEKGREHIPALFASDIDPEATALSRDNAKRAGLASSITFSVADVSELEAPTGAAPGLIATNPPYGERIGNRAQLPALYASFASRLREGFDAWTLAVITSDPHVDEGLGRTSKRTVSLYNGRIETLLHIYDGPGAGPAPETVEERGEALVDGGVSPQVGATLITIGQAQVAVAEANTEQFAARLKKVYAQRRKWARKNDVSCYRIYDADLPDYSVAIDLFEGAGEYEGRRWVHVAEYAPPKEIDPARAARRFSDVLTVVPHVLGVAPADVFAKVRKRARGGSQYAQEGAAGKGSGATGITAEDHLLFEINLSDYLDTGIFLDHRITREMIFEQADRARFLNLFAYTGTATVHAAAGGAFTTTTVDMSQTYLAWAKRNMARNGFSGESHEYVRADCVSWVAEQRHTKNRWDLIFCDVPTFSNSSKMGSSDWDVQRDHVEFLIDVSRLLTRRGLCYFSCNLRSFKPDYEALEKAGAELVDITEQTIPEDFSRSPKIHHCYTLCRKTDA